MLNEHFYTRNDKHAFEYVMKSIYFMYVMKKNLFLYVYNNLNWCLK